MATQWSGKYIWPDAFAAAPFCGFVLSDNSEASDLIRAENELQLP